MLSLNSIIAVYETQTEAEAGVRDLQTAGLDLKKLSILGREHEPGDNVVGYYNTGGHMKHCGARGAFWNDLWKLLPGAAYFSVPGIGRVLMAGPLTLWVVAATQEPAADDLSALGAGLSTINIPKGNILRYESALKMHKLLLVAHGSVNEVLKSKEVLHASRPEEINVHFADDGVKMAA
jgi:hypothetical protein